MTKASKQRATNIVCAIVLTVAGIGVITDFLGADTGRQYLYNFIFFVLVLPGCIALTDVVKWARPDLTNSDLTKSDRP